MTRWDKKYRCNSCTASPATTSSSGIDSDMEEKPKKKMRIPIHTLEQLEYIEQALDDAEKEKLIVRLYFVALIVIHIICVGFKKITLY